MEKVIEQLKIEVNKLLEEDEKLFLVDFVHKGNDRVGKLIILLDGDEGVTIDQCASISRRLSRYIDENMELSSPLTMEVSSAGLDHPITLLRQYKKNVGKNIKVNLVAGEEIEGKLLAVDDEGIEVEQVKEKKIREERRVIFKDITKTIVLISFK
ncbi:MAG: ribosome maturation factor RimP [Cyclobacteriaceae bacterium]